MTRALAPASLGRGGLVGPKRGGILSPRMPSAFDAVPAQQSAGQGWQFPLLLLALLLFGESFEYVNDLPPLYLLTKAWPVLMAPLAVYGAVRCELPYRPMLLIVLFWTLFVSPFMGILVLGNGMLGAASATAKVLPLTTGFSLAAALALTRPDTATLRRGILWLGAITLAAFILLALVVPKRFYLGGIDDSKLFQWDQERGYRLYLPALFGILSLFAVARSCWERPGLAKLLLIAGGLAVMLLLYKQRAPLAAAVVVIGLGFAFHRARWRSAAVAAIVAGGIASLIPIALFLFSDRFAHQLGGSLSTRQEEVRAALAFLDRYPLCWLFGAGSTTRVGEVSFGDIVGTSYFFLADLGWLGVVFEYGVIGCILLLILIGAGLRLGWRARHADPVLGGAVFDYMLFFLLTSVVTPVVFAPGEILFCMAIAWYLTRRADEGAGASRWSATHSR